MVITRSYLEKCTSRQICFNQAKTLDVEIHRIEQNNCLVGLTLKNVVQYSIIQWSRMGCE